VVYFALGSEDELRLQGSRGVPREGQVDVLTPDLPLPLARAVKQRTPSWIESYSALLDAFPEVAKSHTPAESLQAVVAMPLLHAGLLVGAFALSFNQPRSFEEGERRWLAAFASQCALAAERARLYE